VGSPSHGVRGPLSRFDTNLAQRLDLSAIQRGVFHADPKNGVGEIDIPAFGLGPPPQMRGERDLRTR
jgi:hypothetical protein